MDWPGKWPAHLPEDRMEHFCSLFERLCVRLGDQKNIAGHAARGGNIEVFRRGLREAVGSLWNQSLNLGSLFSGVPSQEAGGTIEYEKFARDIDYLVAEICRDLLAELQDQDWVASRGNDILLVLVLVITRAVQSAWLHKCYRIAAYRLEEEQKLLRSIVAAEEGIRQRLALYLHDNVIQILAAVLHRLQSLQVSLAEGETAPFREVREIQHLIRQAIQDCRLLSFDMDSFWLTKAGFVCTIEAYLRNWGNRCGIRAELEVLGKAIQLDPIAEATLFRIIQEALENVRKHARATMVKIDINYSGREVTVEVRDNGVGFDPKDFLDGKRIILKNLGHHLGLLGIEQRAKLLGGTFEIFSGPDQGGTLLRITVPVAGAREKTPSGEGRARSPWVRSEY